MGISPSPRPSPDPPAHLVQVLLAAAVIAVRVNDDPPLAFLQHGGGGGGSAAGPWARLRFPARRPAAPGCSAKRSREVVVGGGEEERSRRAGPGSDRTEAVRRGQGSLEEPAERERERRRRRERSVRCPGPAALQAAGSSTQ